MALDREKSPAPKEIATNDERAQIEKKLVRLFEIGLDDESCIGYHVTSLETIDRIIQKGKISGALETADCSKGDISFYPRRLKFGEHPLAKEFLPDDKEILKRLSCYGLSIAGSHRLAALLGLDFDNPENLELTRRLVDYDIDFEGSDEAFKTLRKRGFQAGDIKKARKQAMLRKGVVLGLSKDLINDFELKPGDLKEGDLKISCPNGLSYKYLSGLEPLGQEERDIFIELQNKHGG